MQLSCMENVECLFCGNNLTEYQVKNKQIYCSRNCRFNDKRAKAISDRPCLWCGKFLHYRLAYYCSNECRLNHKRQKSERPCLTCGSMLPKNRKLYCCKQCYADAQSKKHISEEHKQKISKFMKGNTYASGGEFSPERRAAISLVHKGKPKSSEWRAKMSQSKIGEKNPMYGKPASASSNRKRRIKQVERIQGLIALLWRRYKNCSRLESCRL